MKTVTPDDVRAFLLQQYAADFARKGKVAAEVPDDFDLLREGIIDSLGILEMLEALETRFETAVSLEGVDNDQATRIGPLSRLVAESASKAAA
jgi:hypothetical protein